MTTAAELMNAEMKRLEALAERLGVLADARDAVRFLRRESGDPAALAAAVVGCAQARAKRERGLPAGFADAVAREAWDGFSAPARRFIAAREGALANVTEAHFGAFDVGGFIGRCAEDADAVRVRLVCRACGFETERGWRFCLAEHRLTCPRCGLGIYLP